MYQEYFGFTAPPFELTTNPEFLYFSASHREALSNLEYGLTTCKPVTVLTGEAGTGKTTLVRAAIASDVCRRVQCLFIHNSALSRGEFLEMIALQLGLGPGASQSKAVLLTRLEAALLERRSRGEIVALVVDEAQSLSHDLLEEIRLLANVETNSQKLIPLVLSGQPELAARLNEPNLRQLKQRIALRCTVDPFGLEETAEYVGSRVKRAGGDAARLFTQRAIAMIYERSAGIPRTINVICDNALLTGMALGRETIAEDVVLEVCQTFDLPWSTRASSVSFPAALAGYDGPRSRVFMG
jgi:type II secretory pathway predicted ATPase ExeA